MRRVIFVASVLLILLITRPVIMAVQDALQKLFRTSLGCWLRFQIGPMWQAI
jgi:hypothetical protein